MSDLFVSTRLGFRSAAGKPLWTVHRWRGDQMLGGDHHWVRERYALRAAALYREHPELHGQPESVLRDHGMIFDTDADYLAGGERLQPPMNRPVRIDGVVVFDDGHTHPVRITPEVHLQWGATLAESDAAETLLAALSAAFAATMTEKDDES